MIVPHFYIGRSQIEWNMKVKIEISICIGLMLNDHSNPYIATVLSDKINILYNDVYYHLGVRVLRDQ